ncbi:hypothetical protein SALBM135S_03660 [Streptomyces alboniger]
MGGQRLLLRAAVDVPGVLARGGRVLRRPADRARGAVREVRGQLGRDAGEALLLEVEPALVGGGGVLAGGEGTLLRRRRVLGQPVASPGRVQTGLGGFETPREPLGVGHGFLGGGDAFLEGGPGGVPAVEPGRRVLQQLVVGALLAVEGRAFVRDAGEPPLGPAGGREAAQLLGRLACGGREPGRAGCGERPGEPGTRA